MQTDKKIDAQRAKEIFSENGPEKLRAARAWLRWSLDETAKQTGVIRAYISYYENGRQVLKGEELAAICNAFLNEGLEITEDGLLADSPVIIGDGAPARIEPKYHAIKEIRRVKSRPFDFDE